MTAGEHGRPGPFRGLSFNQATAKHWPIPELLDGCRAAGVEAVGLWREPVHEYGLARTAAAVRAAGLTVTSLCRGGFFHAPGWYDDNRRAVDEAAALGTGELVLVSGGLPDDPSRGRDLPGARARVADAVAELVPHATAAGVRLAVEALHPMYAADRCVISTLDQALAVAEPHPAAAVGVVVDTYHLWWDDRLGDALARAGAAGRIACYQLADWVTPLPAGVLTGRALPGQGCVDFASFHTAVAAAGYRGWVEVEVFDEALWQRPGPEILAAAVAAYRQILPGPAAGS